MAQPKYKILNFTKDNVHWLKGMLPVSVGGNQILTQGQLPYKYKDKDDTGYSSFSGLTNATDFSEVQIGTSTNRSLACINGLDIFLTGTSFANYGKIHTSTGTASTYADIEVLPTNDILYTNARYLGVGYYFTATAGSATTLTVSTQDFNTLGVAASAGHNKIYDLTTYEEYTVTGLEDSNHRLAFSAGTRTPAAGDIFYVFVDDKFELTTSATATEIQFKGQEAPANWVRQISVLDDRPFILNGNYISMLSANEATMTDDYQQLPTGVQATCFSINNDLMLIGGRSKGNAGVLMVYDGFSTYFKSIVNTSSIPASIVAYQSGWIVIMSNGEIRYTDGVSYKTFSSMPDTYIRKRKVAINPNGSLLFCERLYICGSEDGISLRQSAGIHVYDIQKDMWSFIPTKGYYGYNTVVPKALYLFNLNNTDEYIYYAKDLSIMYLVQNDSTLYKDVFLNITLPRKDIVRQVELNLGIGYNVDYFDDSDNAASVSVSSWDGRYGLYGINQAAATSTTTQINVGGTKGKAFVGQEIMILGNTETDSVDGNEYSYITTITNNGESNEYWTISPALTSAIGTVAQSVIQYGFKLLETKTVNYSTINKDTKFNIKDFYGDKLYLHIRMTGNLDLLGVNIY